MHGDVDEWLLTLKFYYPFHFLSQIMTLFIFLSPHSTPFLLLCIYMNRKMVQCLADLSVTRNPSALSLFFQLGSLCISYLHQLGPATPSAINLSVSCVCWQHPCFMLRSCSVGHEPINPDQKKIPQVPTAVGCAFSALSFSVAQLETVPLSIHCRVLVQSASQACKLLSILLTRCLSPNYKRPFE